MYSSRSIIVAAPFNCLTTSANRKKKEKWLLFDFYTEYIKPAVRASWLIYQRSSLKRLQIGEVVTVCGLQTITETRSLFHFSLSGPDDEAWKRIIIHSCTESVPCLV